MDSPGISGSDFYVQELIRWLVRCGPSKLLVEVEARGCSPSPLMVDLMNAYFCVKIIDLEVCLHLVLFIPT
jgi:hypothetical protein